MRYCETLLYRFPTYIGPLKEFFLHYFQIFLTENFENANVKENSERHIHFHQATKIIGKVKNACSKLSFSRSVGLKLFFPKLGWLKFISQKTFGSM